MSDVKKRLMRELVATRRADLVPDKCLPLGDSSLYGGIFDEDDHVVPSLKTACNYHTNLMLLAQDWASTELLEHPSPNERLDAMKALGRDVTLYTNINTSRLLCEQMNCRFEDVFATDVFPFVKVGPMGAKVPQPALLRCAKKYALRQIDIIQPLMVICIGMTTFNAIRAALLPDAKPAKTVDEATAIPSPLKRGRSEIYGVAHTGWRGTVARNKGYPNRVDADWHSLALRLENLVSRASTAR